MTIKSQADDTCNRKQYPSSRVFLGCSLQESYTSAVEGLQAPCNKYWIHTKQQYTVVKFSIDTKSHLYAVYNNDQFFLVNTFNCRSVTFTDTSNDMVLSRSSRGIQTPILPSNSMIFWYLSSYLGN